MDVIDALRADAAKLLTDGRAKVVIGYQGRGEQRSAAFITDPAKVNLLVFDAACKQNLTVYLRKPEVRAMGVPAVVARPAVMRSLILLKAEAQLADGAVIVLAIADGVYHGALDLAQTAALLKDKYANLAPDPILLARIEELGAMSADERARFWTREFAKCTRCYACRAACPGCYCTRCIVEKNLPQWISTAAAEHGNYAWNVIRAFHLAGRCTQCGACEAACPQGIPLMLLNLLLDEEVARRFGERAGYDPEAKPVIGSWKPDDDQGFIR